MSHRLTVSPQMEELDWGILKQGVQLKAIELAEMMSLFKSTGFEKEHIKQMQANAQAIMQTLDLIDEALRDMELEISSLENMQLQIQLGDASIEEIGWFEKREAQD
tara:strand:+ start:570 stop:887 length:318 start_codon:yes stop_codon:yes gene_type:complete